MSVFDDNAEFYADKTYAKHPFNLYLLEFIKSHKGQSLLDVGGGAGIFAQMADVPEKLVVDPSEKLLSSAKQKNLDCMRGSLPDDLNLNHKYDYINMRHVAHHLTGSDMHKSNEMLERSLKVLINALNDGGYLFLLDIYYESYIYPGLSRDLIFHGLNMQNRLKLKLPMKETLKDLSVIFRTRSEFMETISKCGLLTVESVSIQWTRGAKGRMLGLKEWGEVLFVLQVDPARSIL